jgi:hypothetical protein
MEYYKLRTVYGTGTITPLELPRDLDIALYGRDHDGDLKPLNIPFKVDVEGNEINIVIEAIL